MKATLKIDTTIDKVEQVLDIQGRKFSIKVRVREIKPPDLKRKLEEKRWMKKKIEKNIVKAKDGLKIIKQDIENMEKEIT